MRDYINSILAAIGASYLTDDEFDSIDLVIYGMNVETYNTILSVLDSRELVSNTRDRLTYFFLAYGVQVSLPSAAKSNIFIGAEL